MSKKLTFKSVAISAVIALGMTGIVGVSAYAAPSGTVTLAPTTGTEYFVTSGEDRDFSLTSSNTTDAIGTTGLLKWKIVAPTAADESVSVRPDTLMGTLELGFDRNDDSFDISDGQLANGIWYQNDNTVSLFLDNASTKVAVGSEITVGRTYGERFGDNDPDEDDLLFDDYGTTEDVRVTSVSGNIVTYTTSSAQDTISSTGPVDQSAGNSARYGAGYTISFGNESSNSYTSGVLIVNSRHNAASFNKTLVLRQEADSLTTKTVTVTAWVDIDGDNVIDADEETVSPARTVTFINPTEVALDATAGFSFAGVQAGQTTATSSIKTNPVLNQNQSTLVPRTAFTSLTNTNVLNTPTSFWGGSARSTGDASVITSTSDTQVPFTAGVYTGRPYLTATGAASNTAGDYATTYPLGAAVSTVVAADRVFDIIASVAGSNNTSPVDTYGGGTSFVRLATAEVTVSALATMDGDDTPAGAGKTVIATIDDSAFKINGVAGPVTLTTDASGKVSVKITKTAPATAGDVVVNFAAANVDGSIRESSITLDWQAASYEMFNLNGTDTSGVEDNLSVAAGKSVSFAYAIHDQWKVPAPTATYRVEASISGTGVSITSSGPLAWSGNVANLTITNNGTVGASAITVVATAKTGTAFGTTVDTETTNIDVVSSTQTFKAESWSGTSDLRDNIQNINKVVSHDPRASQLARPGYEEDGVVEVGVIVRETNTGLVRPYAKVSISGPADFLFSASDSVDRLGSTSAIADGSGIVTFGVMSNRSVTDAVVRITTEDGTGADVKVTFSIPSQVWARDLAFTAPKSIKAGRTLAGTVAVVDKWGNPVEEDSDLGDQNISFSSNRGLAIVSQPTDDSPTIFQYRILLQPLDRGPVVFSFTWNESSPPAAYETMTKSVAVWSGPAVNATAGAKKGRVIVEAYRAVGKTVDVFVGSTKVASFTPDVANDRFVVRGVKSGTRNVSVRIVGPGYDFPRTAITVK